MPVLTSVDRRLLGRLSAFSPVVFRLLSVLSNEGTSFKEVSRLIALDPVLSGEVLRLANSGLYGRRVKVSSILHAIAILGYGKLSQIAITAALWRGLPRRTAPFVRDWWRHCIAAALVARQSGEDKTSDLAYTAALLHGVGQLAMFQDAPIDYPNRVDKAYEDGTDLLDLERDMFGIDHAALAGLILESWALPQELCEAVTVHHEGTSASGLARAIQIGCAGSEFSGFGRCGCHHSPGESARASMAHLFAEDYFTELVAGINGIEASLM